MSLICMKDLNDGEFRYKKGQAYNGKKDKVIAELKKKGLLSEGKPEIGGPKKESAVKPR